MIVRELYMYRAADLHLCFRICKTRYSHGAAHMVKWSETKCYDLPVHIHQSATNAAGLMKNTHFMIK